MINLFITILLGAITLWIACRLLAWILIAFARKKGIELRISGVGFFTFGGIHFRLETDRICVLVDIEKLWLTSCYFSKSTKKVIGVCTTGAHVDIDLPRLTSHHTEPFISSQTRAKTDKTKYLNIFKWLSFHLDNTHLVLRRGPLEDCLLHVTLKELQADLVPQLPMNKLMVTTEALSAKLLRSSLGEDVEPCLGEVVLNQTIEVDFSLSDGKLTVEELKAGLVKPVIRINEAFLTHFLSRDASYSITDHTQDTSEQIIEQSQRRELVKESSLKMFDVMVEEADIQLCSESGHKDLHVTVATLQFSCSGQMNENMMMVGQTNLNIKDAMVHSSRANMASLSAVHFSVQANEENVAVSIQMLSCFFGYHHHEAVYWTQFVRRLRPTRMVPRPPVLSHGAHQKRRQRVLELLKSRPMSVQCQVRYFSAAIATSTCSGLKGGISECKASLNFRNTTEDTSAPCLELRFDLELSCIYCKLVEGSVPAADMSNKIHHWNTIFYLGILILKGSKASDQISMDTLVDSVQLELSTAASSVLSHLASTILPPPPDGQTASTSTSLLKETPQSSGSQEKSNTTEMLLNLEVTNINTFISYKHKVCSMLRVDCVKVHNDLSEKSCQIQGIKLIYLNQITKAHPVNRSVELHDYSGHIKHVSIIYTSQKRVFHVKVSDDVFVMWKMGLHLCIFETLKDFKELGSTLTDIIKKLAKSTTSTTAASRKPPPCSTVRFALQSNINVTLQLAKDHRVSFNSPGVKAERTNKCMTINMDWLHVSFDEHNIFTVQDLLLTSISCSDELSIERKATDNLVTPANRAWTISVQQLHVIFPYGYHFHECLEQLKLLNKWRKVVHKIVKKQFTLDSKLPPDIVIRIKAVMVQFSDDPFEVRLGDNFKLLCDEFKENEHRRHIMDRKIQDLRKTHGLLPVGRVDELYGSLARKSAELYVQRSKQMYTESPMRSKLWTWKMENLEITAFADISFHGRDNVVKIMKQIDHETPWPEEDLDFVTLWCRQVNVSVDSLVLQLRDYSIPLLDISALHLWGRLVGAEQRGSPRARRVCTIDMGSPWGSIQVERNMPALKFYHDFSCEVGHWHIAYGPCWEPCWAQFNHSQNLVNRSSVDPSKPMPFWDKARLLLHGRLTMSIERMSWIYHASFDPYNTTEMMDWCWSNLILDWTNAKWVLRGDLDIYAHTASKYDDCNLLHLPNLRFCVRLDWVCHGDPNDHHSVMPCAPDKVPEYSMEEHDSFRAFRSQGVNLNVSFDTFPAPHDSPSCQFYASTLRFMDKVKMCLARVSRPIRRGKYFHVTSARKAPMGRHYKNVSFSFNFHKFHICYWASFAKQHGSQIQSEGVRLDMGLQLNSVPFKDGLYHRPRAQWSARKFLGDLTNVTIWVCSSQPDLDNTVSLKSTCKKSCLLSLDKVTYERAEELPSQPPMDDEEGSPTRQLPPNEEDIEDEVACHRVQVHGLKGWWTPSNRDVALRLYDGYVKASQLKRSLSSEALKGFKVDESQSSQKINRSLSMNATGMPLSPSSTTKIYSGHAYSMLTKLVSESNTKFVARHEEMSETGVQREQLHGIQACQTDDVTKKNWHVELYNSQVMLRGKETPGYMIVSAAKASLLSCDHRPVWRSQQLKSKTTLVGSVESMQYFATVDPSTSISDIQWLTVDNIEERSDSDKQSMMGMVDMVGSGQSVGGVISDTVGPSQSSSIQLQRVISRCYCQFFYADYGEIEDKTLPGIPEPPSDENVDMMQKEEGVDCFTLLHHDLNICTNSLQYAMILDIVNNLLLYVEPKKKELTERLQKMRFVLQLERDSDQKTPILQRQEELRQLNLHIRRVERELYILTKEEAHGDVEKLQQQSCDLQNQLEEYKDQISTLGDELVLRVSCYKEIQLQTHMQHGATQAQKEALSVRRYEVCFKMAEWRLTEVDGQIGLADLSLKHFLYTKTNREDDSGAHQFELGWLKANNLQPDTPYKELVTVQDSMGRGFTDRQTMLRILCKFKAPVGGIPVKEHLEVNVVPLVIQLTARFYEAASEFFFPGKEDPTQDKELGDDPEDPGPVVTSNKRGNKADEKLPTSHSQQSLRSSRRGRYSRLSLDDLDIMKERAANNNIFLYVKIPEVPLRVSYKEVKDKNIKNIHDFHFLLPSLEYHNQTWTWHDFAMAIKNDSKSRLITQAVQQKLRIKSRSLFGDSDKTEVQEEDEKAKLLFGALEKAASTSKRSLIGKPSKQ